MAAQVGEERQVKRDFGSFNSSNVQELIELSKDKYRPPVIPIQLPVFNSRVTFGSAMKKEHFYLDESWTFLNHGAFGAAVKQAVEAKQDWLVHIERQPVRFMDREVLPLLVHVVRELADFIDADPKDIVLVPNVSNGISSVVKSVASELSPGDRIMSLNLTYASTKKLLKFVSMKHELIIDEIVIKFPIQDTSEIIKVISDGIHPSTKLAVFDHIPSNYGVILPIKKLIDICHKRGIQVLVDGAHTLGMLSISMRELQADYYVSNAHKWFCCPKGCGFLYVRSDHHSIIRPLVVSHGFGYGFSAEYLWSGLMDYTSYIALLTVIQFWRYYGPQSIREYILKTVQEGAHYLCREWKTELLSDISHFGGLVLVALPSNLASSCSTSSLTYTEAEIVQNVLHESYKIEVPIKVIQGKLYVRISAHVYNVSKDYHRLAAAVSDLTTTGQLIK